MIVAVSAVRVVQMTVDQEVDVVTVRHCPVAAGRTMYVRGVLSAAYVRGRASRGMRGIHLQCTLIDVSLVVVMGVAVVDIVDVDTVLDRRMTADPDVACGPHGT